MEYANTLTSMNHAKCNTYVWPAQNEGSHVGKKTEIEADSDLNLTIIDYAFGSAHVKIGV